MRPLQFGPLPNFKCAEANIQLLTNGPRNAYSHDLLCSLSSLSLPVDALRLDLVSRAAAYRVALSSSAFASAQTLLEGFDGDDDCVCLYRRHPWYKNSVYARLDSNLLRFVSQIRLLLQRHRCLSDAP